MRTCKAFVLGAIVGAAVVWLWGRALEEYVAEKTRGVRTKAAEGVRAVEEKAGEVLDRGGDALRRADEFLQDTKEHVSDALRAGRGGDSPGPSRRRSATTRRRINAMKPATLIGIVLIVVGVLALAYQGITYTTREKVIDLGPLKASVDKEKTIPLPPILGALALAGGVVLVIVGARKS